MAPVKEKVNVLETDISFDMERLFDHCNFDHIPIEKRLQFFKQRNLSDVLYYKTAVKLFGGPSRRTRAIVAPPMETPFKHRLGIYANVTKPPNPPVLNGMLRPPPDLVKLQTEEEVAPKEEKNHITGYNNMIAKRKQLRKDLDNLTPNEAYLSRKKDKSELEKRIQAKYKSDRLWKTENAIPHEVVSFPRSLPDVPTMAVPPPDGLQILDKFLALNNMRLMDLFLAADKDKSWSLSRQEFLNAVTQAEIPMSELEVEAIIITLDADFDERLTYQELNKGLQLWRKHRRMIKKQNEETEKKHLENTSKGHHMKLSPKEDCGVIETVTKEEGEIFRDYYSKPIEKNLKFSDFKIESEEYCKGARDLSGLQENSKVSIGQFDEKNTEDIITLERLVESSPILTPTNCLERPSSKLSYSRKLTENVKKLDKSMKLDNFNNSDLELCKIFSEIDGLRLSEDPLLDHDNGKTSKSKGNAISDKVALPNIIIDKKAFSVLNTSETLPLDNLYDSLVSPSEDVQPMTINQKSEEKELIRPLEIKETLTSDIRPPSHKSNTHSQTSTPNSLEPPESYLRAKAWLPASVEELVDIRKHDRVVLSRNKIRRQLTLESRKAFDELPGVIKIGYKPIDDHCSESTLGGENAEMVDQFRRWKLKEYFDVIKLFEERGLNFTQKTLDKVLLYPGDKPTSKFKRKIIMPVGPLLNEPSQFMKWKPSKKSSRQKDNKQRYRTSDVDNNYGKDTTWKYVDDEIGEGKGFTHKKAHQSGHRRKRKTKKGYLTAEDVYPFASTVTPKVHCENLSSGRALISCKVDSWMTFEDYCKYTQNLPNRFRHLINRSNPKAIWPGYLLNKLRLYMDSDSSLVDGHGRPLENRDSCAYEGYGTGMYNGRGNALFHHTAQSKRAYPGYNNDLLTWPVGQNGVRYGNIDEHRLIK